MTLKLIILFILNFKRRIRNRNLFLMVILVMMIIFAYSFLQFKLLNMKFKPPNMKSKSPRDGYVIKTPGCSIPSLNRFNPRVIQFIFKNPPFKCGNVTPLIKSDLDTLYVKTTALIEYNVTTTEGFSCCYQEMRKKPLPSIGMHLPFENSFIFLPVCKKFTLMIKVQVEFVRVICHNYEKEIYRDFHSFVPHKKSNTNTKKPSVLVVGLDSTSQIKFHQQMPKTAAYLKELNAVEFFGYNRVGENTFPNVIPALTGKSVLELCAICLSSKDFSKPTQFDSCEYIWDDYKKAGFLTAWAEDAAWCGVFTNGNKYGFNKQPTDYYYTLFSYVMESELEITSADICVGSKFIFRTLLNYMQKLIRVLMNESFFGWFWYSKLNLASLGDKDYKHLFYEMNRTNVLNDTFVVFMSDHGIRGDGSYQGFLEARVPFLYILVPPWFELKYPTAAKNLKINSKKLLTTFDIHETLKDLVNIDDLTTELLNIRTETLMDTRGISLFLPILEERTCKTAGIATQWCTCFQCVSVEITDQIVDNIVNYVLNSINLVLNNYESCDTLALDSVIEAGLLVPEKCRNTSIDILKSNLKMYNYIVVIKTTPGEGIFESTVRCYNCEINGDFEVQGEITRLNQYENDGKCILDTRLHPFCHCKNDTTIK